MITELDVFFGIIIFTVCALMPIGAITCFHMAWNAENESPERAFVKILLLAPATVCPFLVLNLTAGWRPEWQEFGPVAFRYMAKSTAARPFYPLFLISNGIIAFSIARKHFTRISVLTTLSLLTCLMTCFFFAFGNTEKKWVCLLQFSMCCGYAYGLFLVLRSGELIRLLPRRYPLLTGWFTSVVVTVVLSFARSRELIAQLPDKPPLPRECFIVTAAARGHQTIVNSSVDCTTGRLTNSQLAAFRALEDWMIRHIPRVHRVARSVYNVIAPPIARSIIFRWQADLVYLLLKPLEWLVRSVL